MTQGTTVGMLSELEPRIGESLGLSRWLKVEQEQIDAFAGATGDHQWIHVDPQRAREGPFGTTIAHGYLTLSLFIPLWEEILVVRRVHTKVNYGLNRVRFTGPVPVGSRIRAAVRLAALDPVSDGAQLTVDATLEREGAEKPVCVLQAIFRFFDQ